MKEYNNRYCEDNLKKYSCDYCEKEFIVGEKTSNYSKLSCPYCRWSHLTLISYTDDEKLESMNMSYMGIAFDMNTIK